MADTWNRRTALFAARASFASITLWIALTTALRAADAGLWWTVFDLPFRLLCHRIPERVISIAGTPLPLCSRCAGIWIGASLSAAFAWPVLPLRTLRVVLPIALGLMGIEVLTQDLGLHPVFHPTRLLSGLLISVPLGGAVGGMITRELSAPRLGGSA
jgi:uncharacterized membrane protein